MPPFGSTAHRVAILKPRAAGLDPAKDVHNVNLDALAISRRVLAGGVGTWGTTDAVVVWEPSASNFELRGLARSLSAELALAMTFTLVMLIIFDLDRPGERLIEVNQQPMI